jgi:hydrogenase-4 component E
MHLSDIDLLTAVAAAAGVWMCGITRIEGLLWSLAVQTTVLGVVAVYKGIELHAPVYYLLAALVIGVKAIPIPCFLSWVAGRIGIQRDRGILLAPHLALLAGFGAVTAGYFLAREFIGPGSEHGGAAGMALAHLLIGMLLMLTRRLALTQVIGFLVLENGIFLYALTQTHGMPLMVEMGVVLDVMVGVMLAGLVIFRLNGSFEHIDVTRLRGLRG